MDNINLRVYGYYNFLRSTIEPRKYLNFLKEKNFKFGALVSVDHVFGLVDFIIATEKNNIQPLVGLTISNFWIDGQKYEITIYPKNGRGLECLFELSSQIMCNENAVINLDDLKKFNNDALFVFTANNHLNEEMIKIAIKKMEFLKKNLYLGLVDFEQPIQNYKKYIKEKQILLFVSVNFLEKEEKNFYEKMKKINEKENVYEFLDVSHFLLEKDLVNQENWEKFNQNKEDFISQISLNFLNNQKKKKTVQFHNDPKNENKIRKFCEDKIAEKFHSNKNYLKRFEYEFEIIKNKNLINYFFTVWDYVKFAKGKSILIGPGRGSASGCLVAYLLEITQIDPLKYDLIFERFLNPNREEMPDIDLDFEDQKRGEVINYIFNKYPKGKVALISIFQRFGLKMALRDAGRILNIPLPIINEISSLVPVRANIDFEYFLMNTMKIQKYIREYKELFEFSKKLIGLPRQKGKHAAGILISEEDLRKLTGVWADDNQLVVQLEMDSLNDLNLLKMDILALKKLSLISNLLEQIGIKENKNDYLAKIDLQKTEVYEMLQKGDTGGVFQLESQGMIDLIKKIKPKTIDDISTVISLYRPGPFKNIESYLSNSEKKGHFIKRFPFFEKILEKTRGIPIYQEQILKMIQEFAGFSLGESEIMRKAISKIDFKLLNSYKHDFVEGAKKKNRTEEEIQEIWNVLQRYANYGFNFSHALSYSIIAYLMAYFKTFQFDKFITLLLDSVIGDFSKTQEYLFMVINRKMKIVLPSVNQNLFHYRCDGQNVQIPMISIKKIGENWLKKLEDARIDGLFKSPIDFVARMKLKGLSNNVFKQLIYAGALDEFEFTQKTLLENEKNLFLAADIMIINNQEINWKLIPKNMKLKTYPSNRWEEWKKINQVLGLRINYDLLKQFIQQNVKNQKLYSLNNISIDKEAQYFYSAFIVEKIKIIQTKYKDNMGFCEISDFSDYFEIVVFPDIWKNSSIKEGDMIIGELRKKIFKNKKTYYLNKIDHSGSLIEN